MSTNVKTCQMCKTPFRAKRRDAKTCSNLCRKNLQRGLMRQAAAKAEKLESDLGQHLRKLGAEVMKQHALLDLSETGAIAAPNLAVPGMGHDEPASDEPFKVVVRTQPKAESTPVAPAPVVPALRPAPATEPLGSPQPADVFDDSLEAPVTPTTQLPLREFEPANTDVSSSRTSLFRFNGRAVLVTVSLLVIVSTATVLGFLLTGNKSPSKGQDQSYAVRSLSLQGVKNDVQLSVGQASRLSINGQLRANNGFVLAPTPTPSDPTFGQFYLNGNDRQVYYYDGTKFVALASADSVAALQAASSRTSTSFNQAGKGLTSNGSTVSNSGVTSLSGTAGQIQVSSATGDVQISLPDLAFGGLLYGGGTSGPLGSVATAAAGECLISNGVNQAPSWQSCPGVQGNGTVFYNGTTTVGHLPKFSASNTITDSIVSDDGSTVTVAGNLSVSGVISGNGSGLTALNASNISSGTLDNARLSPSVTLAGNTFNGANQLVQLNGSTQLPAVSGALLTNLNASNITSGTLNDARLSANVALLNGTGPQTFTGTNLFKPSLNSVTTLQVQASGGTSVLDVDTVNSRVGIGTAGPGYKLDVQGGNINTSGQYLVGGAQISSANLSNDANLAKLDGNQTFTGSNTFNNLGNSFTGDGANLTNLNASNVASGTLGVTYGGTGLDGSAASNGQLLIGNGTGYSLSTLTAGSGITITNSPGGIQIDAFSAGSCGSCAQTNLSNLAGVAINTSLLSGANNIDLGSGANPFRDLYLGGTATNNFHFSGTATAARSFVIPDVSGTLAVSASGNIALNPTTGNITFTGVLPIANGGTNTSATPTAGGLAYGNGSALAFTSFGLNGQIVISGGGGSPSFQDLSSLLVAGSNIAITGTITPSIAVVANPSFTSLTASSSITINGTNSLSLGTSSNLGSITFHDGASANTGSLALGGTLSSNAAFVLPVSSGTQTLCTAELGNCAGSGGGTTGSGTLNRLAKFTSTGATIGDSNISDNGTVVTVSTGAIIQGSAGLTLGTTGVTGKAVFKNSANTNTLTLQAGATGGNLAFTLPTADGVANDCLKTDGFGGWSFAACTGGPGGGVTSVNSQSGVVTIAGTTNQINISQGGGTITLATPQDIATTSDVSFGTLALNGNNTGDNLIVANAVAGATGNLIDLQVNGSSKFSVDPNGNITASGTFNGNSLTITDITASGNITTTGGNFNAVVGDYQTAGVTRLQNNGDLVNIGTITTSGLINGQDISSAASFSGTLAFTTLGTPGSTALCRNGSNQLATCSTNSNNVDLQQAYNAATNPEIVVNATNGALTVRDASTPLGANLLEVQNNTGSTTYFAVTSAGTVTTGNSDITGQYRVGGSQISSANLSNDANLAKLNAGQTFTGANIFSNASNSFTGNGSGLTALNASNISSGTLADARLSGNVALLNAHNLFKNTSDSLTSFQIQNATGTTTLFNADTIDGRIGIGNAAPGYPLDVTGDINTSGVYRINGVTVCSGTSCTPSAGSNNYIQNGTGTQTANFNIQSADPTYVGGIIEGAASQSADLFQIKTSTPTNVVSVGATGNTTFSNSTNSANAFLIQNSSAANLLQVDTLNNNVVVGGNNSGELQTWQTNANALPTTLFNHSTVTANGYVYAIGGNNGSGAVSSVYYAKLNADGTIGSWVTNANSLPDVRFTQASVTANGYIYAIGGIITSFGTNTVYYAKLNSDGSTGTWKTNTNALPVGLRSPSSVVANGYVYVMGGSTSAGGFQSAVYYAKLNADGSTGSWTTSGNSLPQTLAQQSSVVANGYVYILGGYNGSEQSTVYYAKLNADGSIGSWTTSGNALPLVLRQQSSVVADGYVYVLGGSSGGSQQSAVYYAKLNADGSIGSWATNTAALPQAVCVQTSIVANGYVYAIGGFTSTGVSTVYYASTQRLKVGGSLDLVGLSAGTWDANGSQGQGSVGGSLTAGDTNIIGTLQLQGQANFAQGLGIGGALSVAGSATVQTATNTTTAFQVQNSAGTQLLNADTTNLGVTVGSGTQTLFAAKVDYTTAAHPRYTATADFNGDGKQDIAVTNENATSMSVFMGNGDGTFVAKVDYTTGAAPRGIVTADFNGDGKPDIAVTDQTPATISIFLNNGDGTFAPKVDYTTGTSPQLLTAADFNGDGKQDLATPNSGSNTVSVLMGNGDGTFATKVDYATGSGPRGIVSGDLNGDGKPDMAVVNSASTVSVFINSGTGTFAAKVDYATGSNPQDIAIADLNGDGKPDLAVGNVSGVSISVLINNGNGTFATKVDYTTNTTPEGVIAADFNGDGRIDLAGASIGNSTVSILTNKGNGTFAPKVDFTVGSTPVGGSAADFNGDGKPDLVIANNSSNTLSVLLNQTLSPGFTKLSVKADEGAAGLTLQVAQASGSAAVQITDTNGNVLTQVKANGAVQIGDPTMFASKVNYTTGTSPQRVISGDFNGDGKLDLAIANFNSTMSVFINNGNGTYAAKVDYTTGTTPIGITAADFNSDGKLDLAVANDGTTTLSVFINNGDGTFAAKVDYTTGTAPFSIVTADFNGDGKADLAVPNATSNTMSVLMNNGDGTFAAKVDYTTGTAPRDITAADFNGDGKLDLAVVNQTSATMSVFLNNGTGTFAAKVDYATGTAPRGVAAADLNGDGKIDLIAGNATSNTISVFIGSGTGTFATKVDYTTGGSPQIITAADFNGDNKIDLAVSNNTSATISVFINNGNGTLAPKIDYAAGTGTQGVTSGDFNNDGKTDIAATNNTAATMSVFINQTNGPSRLSVSSSDPTQSVALFQAANGQTADILRVQGGTGTTLFKVDANGAALFQNSTNSTTAFQVQNASAGSLFQIDSTNANITLNGLNSGEPEAWSTDSNALPTATLSGASVTANGYVYVMGGGANTSATSSQNVYYARLNADGTVGAWTTQTNQLNTAVSQAGAAVYNGYIYLVGGASSVGGTRLTTVQYAKINADGSTGTWNTTTALASTTSGNSVQAYNGYLYSVAGQVAGSLSSVVLYAKINADGSIGSWQTNANALPVTWGSGGSVIANGYYYLEGASAGTASASGIYYAKLNSDGSTGVWSTNAQSLGSAATSTIAAVANGYLYAIGGSSTKNIYYGRLASDGSVGAFSSAASANQLPNNSIRAQGVVKNGYFYQFGGTTDGTNAITTVVHSSESRVKVAGALDLVGLSANNLTEGGSGGELTAGNTNIIGALQVQGAAQFARGLGLSGNLTVNGSSFVAADSASTVASVIRGASSQTADLLQLQDSSGNINGKFSSGGNALTLGRIASSGTVTAGTLSFADGTTDNFGGTLQTTTLTANRTYTLPDSTGTFCLNTQNCAGSGTGYILNGTTLQTNANFNIQSAAAGSVGGVIKGATSQTADLFQIQDSTGANLNRIDASGNQENLGYYNNPIGGIGPYANLLTYSEQFDNAAWVKNTNITTPVTADTVPAPDGNTSAEVLVATATSNNDVTQTTATAVGSTYTFSLWMRAAAGTPAAQIQIIGSVSGTGTAQTVNLTTTWQRFSVTTNTAGFSGNVKVRIYPGSAGSTGQAWVWGAQLVQASVPQVYSRATASAIAASAGVVSNGGLFVSAINASDKPLIIQGAPSQSGDLLENQNSSGNLLSGFDSTGKLRFADGAGGAFDTNLYRSAAATLSADDQLVVTAPSTATQALNVVATPSVNSGTVYGENLSLSAKATADSSASYRGLFVNASLGNNFNYTGQIIGGDFQITSSRAVTLNTAIGARSLITQNTAAGTIQNAYGFYSDGNVGIASGNITNFTGHYAANPTVSAGSITNNIGVDIVAQTAGSTSNIGLRVAKANTYSIQLSDTGGTAAGGIEFGTDTDLYRSAASTLKTDSALQVIGTGYFGGNVAVGNSFASGTTGALLRLQSGTNNLQVLLGRTSDEAKLIVVNSAGNFFTNTAVGDAGYQLNDSTKTLHLGVGSGNSQLAISNTAATLNANILANGVATGTTGTTSGTGGVNTTTITLSAAGSFANNDVIFVDNTGGSGQDYYTRIVSGGGTTTLTVDPAVSYGTAASYTGNAAITKYTVQNIGNTSTDYTTQANRFFQGSFLGQVTVGAGTTKLSDGQLLFQGDTAISRASAGSLLVQAQGSNATSLIVKATASQASTELLQLQDSSGNVIQHTDSTGRLAINSTINDAAITVVAKPTADATINITGVDALTTNLIINPSFEVNTTGWATTLASFLNAGATLTKVAASGSPGSSSGQVVTTSGSANQGIVAGTGSSFTVGRSYSGSVLLKGNAGGESVEIFVGDIANNDYERIPVTLTASWQRFNLPDWVPTANRTSAQMTIRTVGATAYTFFVDGAELVPRISQTSLSVDTFASNTIANYTIDASANLVQIQSGVLASISSDLTRAPEVIATGNAPKTDLRVTAYTNAVATGSSGISRQAVIIKRVAAGSFISIGYNSNDFTINKMVNGSATQLASLGTGPAWNNPGWLRGYVIGNQVIGEWWGTDPALGGHPGFSISYTLTGADATTYGAGVAGYGGAAPSGSRGSSFGGNYAYEDDLKVDSVSGTPYIDGDTPGYGWTGTPHSSSTTNTALITNLATNPSAEIDTSSWSAPGVFGRNSGGTISRDTTVSTNGLASLKFVTTGNFQMVAQSIPGTFKAGVTYTARAKVRDSINGDTVGIRLGDSGASDSAAGGGVASNTGWTEISVAWTPSADRTSVVLGIEDNGVTGLIINADAISVVAGSNNTGYFDGTMSGASWNGTPQASTSTRSASGFANNILNGSFESGTTAWQASTGSNYLNTDASTIAQVSTLAKYGTASMQVVSTSVAHDGAHELTTGTFYQGVPYTFSMWVKGNAGGEQLKLTAGNFAGTDSASTLFTATTGWQQVSVTWVPAATVSSATAGSSSVDLVIRTETASVYTFQVDGVTFTQGTTAPAYFDGDSTGAFWNGAQRNSSSELVQRSLQITDSQGGVALAVTNTGNVGIGKAATTFGLDVASGGASFQGTSGSTQDILRVLDGSGNIVNKITSTGAATFENSTNSTTAFQVQNASATSVLDVDTTNGRVGIGTAAPGYKLEVDGSGTATGSATISLNESGTRQWLIGAGLTVNGRFSIQNGSNTTDAITINATNQVGIGTTAPGEVLQVNGAVKVTGAAVTNLANSAVLDLALDGSSNAVGRILVNGKDTSTNGTFQLISQRSGGTNALTALSVNSSGQVGIGQASAAAALDVNGTVKVNNTISVALPLTTVTNALSITSSGVGTGASTTVRGISVVMNSANDTDEHTFDGIYANTTHNVGSGGTGVHGVFNMSSGGAGDFGVGVLGEMNKTNMNAFSTGVGVEGKVTGTGASGANGTTVAGYFTNATAIAGANYGIYADTTSSGTAVALLNRGNDGTVVQFASGGTVQGTISISGATTSYNAFTGSHYAYSNDSSLQEGELLSQTGYRLPANTEIEYQAARSATANDPNILGSYLAHRSDGPADGILVSAAGNGDMWVEDTGGNITEGQYLISSDVPGHAMADPGSYPVSHIIGRAQQSIDWSQITNTVMVNGQPVKHAKISVYYSFFDKNAGSVQSQAGNFTDLNVSGTATINNLTVNTLNVNGLATIQDLKVTGSAQFTGDITVGGHIITAGGQPVSQVMTAAGAGASVTITGNDTSGTISIVTGNNPTAGDLVKFIFGKAYTGTPHVVMSASNDNAAGLRSFRGVTTLNDFLWNSKDVPTANTTYQYDYFISQ